MVEGAGASTGDSLLAVFAHPDDESLACGGLFARCAATGARVTLVCATRGEHGPGAGEGHGDRRARELEAAARVLGVSEIVLLNHEDGMLPWMDAAQLEEDIRLAIRRHRPDVVVTFGDDGLYGHPDHIAVYERTTAAVAALDPDAPALYYVTVPPGRMRAVVDAAAVRSPGSPPGRILGIADADAFGAVATAPTLVIEAGELAIRKLEAIKCHHSQLDGDALAVLADSDAIRLLGTEHFTRAAVGARGPTFIERFGQTG